MGYIERLDLALSSSLLRANPSQRKAKNIPSRRPEIADADIIRPLFGFTGLSKEKGSSAKTIL